MAIKILKDEVGSWRDLAEVAEKFANGGYQIYRGLRDISYGLRPSIGREGARRHDLHDRKKLSYNAKEERFIFREFKRQARPYFGNVSFTDLEWMAIAQHHGLPTRLLDWTGNLFAAAWFAAQSMAAGKNDAAIVALGGVPEVESDADPFEIETVSIFRPPHLSPRIPAQQGLFTIHPDPSTDFDPKDDCFILRIKRGACAEIKRTLDSVGVNYGTLFPDVDGLADALTWRYKWYRLPA